MKNNGVGRPAMEGRGRKYIVADDVHAWIIKNGGGQYITDVFRAIKAQYSLDNSEVV